MPSPSTPSDAVRIDRWLWAARFYKTRSQASKACVAGHVHNSDGAVKPSKLVRVGDAITLVRDSFKRQIEVAKLAHKRGPATVAQTLYIDHTPPPPPRDETRVAVRERGAGRPSKRQRREITRWRGR